MRRAWNTHPNLLSWAVLALGMVMIVVFSARDVGFQPAQWAAIIGATVILAGLCVWIVSWEDSAEGGSPEDTPSASGQETGRGAAPARDAMATDVTRNGDL